MRRGSLRWLSSPSIYRTRVTQIHPHRGYSNVKSPDLVSIVNASFYRDYPADKDDKIEALFKEVSFNITKSARQQLASTSSANWAIVSPASLSGTTFLEVLGGKHICIPPSARTYPYLAEKSRPPSKAIQYVGFDAQRGSGIGGSNVRGAYLSSRYESRKEVTDFTLLQYLSGQTQLNAENHQQTDAERAVLDNVTKELKLKDLLDMPVANLSNGQTRRARIAYALMSQPDLLLLDGPFMGLDPMSRQTISNLLGSLSEKSEIEIVLNFTLGEQLPKWISHLILLDEEARIVAQGPHAELEGQMTKMLEATVETQQRKITKDGFSLLPPRVRKSQSQSKQAPEVLIDMQGVKVSYGDRAVLGDWQQSMGGESKPGLWWQLARGQRCAVFGPNGSGKTTLLSLITSDHPQAYSLPIKFFGRSRLPETGQPGISLFDIQKRMGHSSPEIHAFFPKHLTVRRVLESAWAEAPLVRPVLTSAADRRVDAYLRWWSRELNPARKDPTPLEQFIENFHPVSRLGHRKLTYQQLLLDESDLEWADQMPFSELSFSNQRLLLFLRAMVAEPDIVILDEALSGVDEAVRDKALLFLSWGESRTMHPTLPELKKTPQDALDLVVETGLTDRQALLVISHSEHDVPGCIRDWICLPEAGEGRPPKMGTLNKPLNAASWKEIWSQET